MNIYFKHLSIIAYILLAPGLLNSAQSADWNNVQNKLKTKPFQFFRITIPKAGTHLLIKCIKLITAKNIAGISHNPDPVDESHPKKCVKTTGELFLAFQENQFKKKVTQTQNQPKVSFHLPHTAVCENFVNQCVKATLFMIRDPRDQLVSFTMWTCAKSRHGSSDFNNMLLDFIDGRQRNDVHSVRQYEHCNAMWSLGIAEYYKLYLPWMAAHNVYTVRFENLVGKEGGGSRDAQIQEIINIAHYLKIKLSPSKINAIVDNLFGGTNTFNKGQIGSWKVYFTPEHKKAFKEVAGQLLIDLGYEKDMNW